MFTLIINYEEYQYPEPRIGYHDVVDILKLNEKKTYNVMYESKCGDWRRDGLLIPGENPVEVRDNMSITVALTDSA